MRDCKKFCWRKGSYNPVKPQPAPLPQEHDYSLDYLTTEALEDGTIAFNIYIDMGTEYITSISYSTDDGNSWTTVNNVDDKEENLVIPVSVSQGDKILWKGDAKQTGFYDNNEDWYKGSFFSSGCEFNAYGNIMSLCYGDNFIGQTTLDYDGQFACLFYGYNNSETCQIVSAENFILPATTLADNCYVDMFSQCTSLTTAPELPATTLTDYCYDNMFIGCISLTTAPELPATTLAEYCYYGMFYGCTSLTASPELHATTLAEACYGSMFRGCTLLTIAPELPATTLASYCYADMFNGCTNLNYIKCLATDISATGCTTDLVRGVASTGTFVKDASMEDWKTGGDGIPKGWTVQDA